jgi:hypothetical protein
MPAIRQNLYLYLQLAFCFSTCSLKFLTAAPVQAALICAQIKHLTIQLPEGR